MSFPELAELGWNVQWDAKFAQLSTQGLVPGRVALEHNHVYRVLTSEGEQLAEAAGRLKHDATGQQDLPVVGDWVAVRVAESGGRTLLRHVLPRTTWISRKAAGRETLEQVLAANIDTAFLVFGLDKPVNRRAIERYLVVTRAHGVTPVVVLNKDDLVPDVGAAAAEAQAAAGETEVVAVSSRTGDGFEGLAAHMAVGRTVALLGPSGVGKSSIVNRLVGDAVLPVGEVRDWDHRGRHTSVHRQLVTRAAGGLVIDTPGMRELQLWDTDQVADAFADIAELGETCRFRDCHHDREPGCAVKSAVEQGALAADRHGSFLKLQREQADLERKREEREKAPSARSTRIVHQPYRSSKTNRDR